MPSKNDSQNTGSKIKGKLVGNNLNTYPALSSVIRKEANGFVNEDSKFPRIEECVHFHYETIDYNELNLSLADISADLAEESQVDVPSCSENHKTPLAICVKVKCKNNSWIVRRSLEHFEILDSWLHECVFERKFSCLSELKVELLTSKSVNIQDTLRLYLTSLTHLANENRISCAPILHWFECDNHGRNIPVPHALGGVADINIPAIAAASVIRRYTAQDDDELDLEVGDMVSIIEMGQSGWWRGKRAWRVGSFPSQCVRRINCSSDVDVYSKAPLSPSANSSPVKPIIQKHGKFMEMLRSFLDTRPSRALLRRKGILRERVFGCDLCELLHRTGEQIPAVVTDCTSFVEKHGIVDGIYRISGVSSQIRLLRYEFDTENKIDLETEFVMKKGIAISGVSNEGNIICDPHSVAGLCKRYFRDLPNPLITYQLYNKFVEAVTSYEDEKRLLKVHDVIQQLPPPHYRTLKHIIMHLKLMASKSERTSMHSRNLAIVWAPNLLRSKEIESGKLGPAAFDEARIQSVVTEFLIIHCNLLFSETLEPLQFNSVHKPPRPRSLMIVPTPKLISLEEAQELSKNGKLSANTKESIFSPEVVKFREQDKNKLTNERRRKSYGGLTTKQRNRQTTINHLLLQNVTFPTEEEIKQIQLNELQSHSRIDSQS